jgi:hypothetical protein
MELKISLVDNKIVKIKIFILWFKDSSEPPNPSESIIKKDFSRFLKCTSFLYIHKPLVQGLIEEPI